MKIKEVFNQFKGSFIVIALWLILGWLQSYGIHSVLLFPLNYLTGALAGIDEGSFIGGTIGKTIILLFLSSFLTNLIVIKGSLKEKIQKATSGYKNAMMDTIPFLSNTISLFTSSLKGLSFNLLGMGVAVAAYGFLTGNGSFENSFITVLIFFNICSEIADGTGIVSAILNLMLSRWGRKRVDKQLVEWILNGTALGCLLSFGLAIFVSSNMVAYGVALIFIIVSIGLMIATNKKAMKATVALILVTSPMVVYAVESDYFSTKYLYISVGDQYIETGEIQTGIYECYDETYTISNILKNNEVFTGESIDISYVDGYNRTVEKIYKDFEEYLSDNYNASVFYSSMDSQDNGPSEYDSYTLRTETSDDYSFDMVRSNVIGEDIYISANIVYEETEEENARGYYLDASGTLLEESIHIDHFYIMADEIWVQYTIYQNIQCEWPILTEYYNYEYDNDGNEIQTGPYYQYRRANEGEGVMGTITHTTTYYTTVTIEEYMEEAFVIDGRIIIDQDMNYTGINETLEFDLYVGIPFIIDNISLKEFALGDSIFGPFFYMDEPVDENDQTMDYDDVAYCEAYTTSEEEYNECMGISTVEEENTTPLTPAEKVLYGSALATTFAGGISLASQDKKKIIEELMKIATKHIRKISLSINGGEDLADVICVEKNTIEIPFNISGGDDLTWNYMVLMLAQKDHKRHLPAVVIKNDETHGLISLALTGNELVKESEVIECVLTAQSNDEYGHIIEVETLSFNLVKPEISE
ncbi:MAG: hypothetical protein R3Y57_04740 [Erysipelotrichaceae bacterium]